MRARLRLLTNAAFCILHSALCTLHWLLCIGFCALFASCHENPVLEEPLPYVKKTVLMVYPWSGNLYKMFVDYNIPDMEKAMVAEQDRGTTECIIWIANSAKTALLIRTQIEKNPDGTPGTKCKRDTLERYMDATPGGNLPYMTEEGLTRVFSDMKAQAQSDDLSLIIGSHGTGWIPSGCRYEDTASKLMRTQGKIKTRWWGSASSLPAYNIEAATLSDALKNNDISLRFLYFDACLMANLEAVMQLKDVTHYFIGSPCETIDKGSPFAVVGPLLLAGDYEGAINAAIGSYGKFKHTCRIMACIDCTCLPELIALTAALADKDLDTETVNELQYYEGLSSHVFFDLADYIHHLPLTETETAAFDEALAKAVPFCAHTDTFFSAYNGEENNITTTCGLSTTLPSQNEAVKRLQNPIRN